MRFGLRPKRHAPTGTRRMSSTAAAASRCWLVVILFVFATQSQSGHALPRNRFFLGSQTTRFSRERVKLGHPHQLPFSNDSNTDSIDSHDTTLEQQRRCRRRQQLRQILVRMDACLGIGFVMMCLQVSETMLKESRIDQKLRDDFGLWILTIRMIAVNHLGLVAGLLVAPPDAAVKIATIFWALLGGVSWVFLFLWEETPYFWLFTGLVPAVIGVHVHCWPRETKGQKQNT